MSPALLDWLVDRVDAIAAVCCLVAAGVIWGALLTAPPETREGRGDGER
jgi:hypothetical protein